MDKEKEKISFEKSLWGQYDKLHERLNKKREYYSNLYKAFQPLLNLYSELNEKIKNVKFSMDPTIPMELLNSDSKDKDSQWYGIPLTMKKIKEFIEENIDFTNQTLFHVITNIKKLIDITKKDKNIYDDLIKSQNIFSESKNIMNKNMKIYHQKMFAAEQAVLDLKKIEIKIMSLNNDSTLILESKDISEIKAYELTNFAIKPFNAYEESVKKANELWNESMNKQKYLLYTYQEIEEQIGKINVTISNLFLSNLKFQKELIEEKVNEITNLIKNINTKKELKQLAINLTGYEKPEEEILFKNYPSVINFDNSNSNETFQIYSQSIEFIKNIIRDEFPNFDQDLENDKNNMREITYKLIEEYSEEGRSKLLKYIKNQKTHNYFLILLKRIRSNNKFHPTPQFIDLIGIILNIILNFSEKDKNYENAKKCIYLSQTFLYVKNEKKCDLLEKIRKHKWLTSKNFWINFIDEMINQEFDKFITNHPQIIKEKILKNSENINDKIKLKLSELLFSQLLPYVNNMNEFNLGIKNIIQITLYFCEKYKFLGNEQKEALFGLISDNKDEIERLIKECQTDNNILKSNIFEDENKKLEEQNNNGLDNENNNNSNKKNNINKKINNRNKRINNTNNNNIFSNIIANSIKNVNNILKNNKLEDLNNNSKKLDNKKIQNQELEKSQNNEGKNLINSIKNFEKLDIDNNKNQENKKDEKEESKIENKKAPLMKKVQIKNSNSNPFGVVLKKVPIDKPFGVPLEKENNNF